MKNKSCFMIYLLLFFALITLSITTTLALIRDSETKTGNILKFDKVSLYGDKVGSVLSFEVRSESVGYGQVVYDIDYDEPLKITPTSDTEDMFIRFKVSFSLNNDKLNQENEELLEKLNNEELIHNGIVLNNDNNNGYGFTYFNGWYYLVTTATGEDHNLKVARLTDVNGFEIIDKFTLYYDQLLENDIISLCEQHSIYLKIDAVAIQCLGLSSLTPEDLGNVILSNEGQTNYEDLYGNIKIGHFEKAVKDNLLALTPDITVKFNANYSRLYNLIGETANVTIDGSLDSLTIVKDQVLKLPTTEISSTYNKVKYYVSKWLVKSANGKEINSELDYLTAFNNANNKVLLLYAKWEKLVTLKVAESGPPATNSGWLGSKSVNSNLTRNKIISLKFVGTEPNITNAIKVDCGTISGVITAYWVNQSGKYNVTVYQEGGVIFNPNSTYLFSYFPSVNIDMTNWDINTTLVTNMGGMFEGAYCKKIILGEKFDTSNVTDMWYMFAYAYYVEQIDLGPNFDTFKVTNMSDMFRHLGSSANFYHLDLGEKFVSNSLKTMVYMFFWCGEGSLQTLNLRNFGVNRPSSITITRWSDWYDSNIWPFKEAGTSNTKVYVKNTNVESWIEGMRSQSYWGKEDIIVAQ